MRTILVAGGLTAAAVAAVIGAASTNSISGVNTQTMGYTSADINSPATVSSVVYNVSPTADDSLTSVALTFATALPTGQKIQVGFGAGAFVPCTDSTHTNTNATGVVTTSATGFTCELTGQTATGATKFRLLVTG